MYSQVLHSIRSWKSNLQRTLDTQIRKNLRSLGLW